MSAEENNMEIEEQEVKVKKPQRRGTKERMTRLIARTTSDSIQDLYEDILNENSRLKNENDKLRNLNISIQREYDELRQGLLCDRMNKLI